MRVGVPKEVYDGEQRVALTPETATFIHKLGHQITIESGAGAAANYSDQQYKDAGVTIAADVRKLWSDSDVILKVRAPQNHPDAGDEVELLNSGSPDQLFVACTKPGAFGQAGCKRGYRNGDGFGAAYLASSKA